MTKATWGRPLHPTRLPVIGSLGSLTIAVASALLFWRRRRAHAIEIKLFDQTVGVVNQTTSPESAKMMLHLATHHRRSLANIFAGHHQLDAIEERRARRRLRRELRRLLHKQS